MITPGVAFMLDVAADYVALCSHVMLGYRGGMTGIKPARLFTRHYEVVDLSCVALDVNTGRFATVIEHILHMCTSRGELLLNFTSVCDTVFKGLRNVHTRASTINLSMLADMTALLEFKGMVIQYLVIEKQLLTTCKIQSNMNIYLFINKCLVLT